MPPSRYSIAFTVFLIVLCVGSAVRCAYSGQWGWALVSAGLVAFLVREVAGDLAERRYCRARRPS